MNGTNVNTSNDVEVELTIEEIIELGKHANEDTKKASIEFAASLRKDPLAEKLIRDALEAEAEDALAGKAML